MEHHHQPGACDRAGGLCHHQDARSPLGIHLVAGTPKIERQLRANAFRPEYLRTLEEIGSRHEAEVRLHRLQKRVRSFSIRALPPEEGPLRSVLAEGPGRFRPTVPAKHSTVPTSSSAR